MKRVRYALGVLQVLGLILLWYLDASQSVVWAYLAVSFLFVLVVGRRRRHEPVVESDDYGKLKEKVRPAKPRRKIPGAPAVRRIQNVAYSYPWQSALGWGALVAVVLAIFTVASWLEILIYGGGSFLLIGLWCSRQGRRRQKSRSTSYKIH